MAPNLRKVELLTSDALENVSALMRNKMSHSASRAMVEEVPCASYWDWPAEEAEEVDIFSVSHIEANLVQGASKPIYSSDLVAEHDDYWAESCSYNTPMNLPLHHQPQEQSAWYWNGPVYQTTETDMYWQESTTHTRRHCHGPSSSADAYWDEACHEQTAVDRYWQEGSRDSDSFSYWREASHAQTGSDQYWSMVAR